jgi:capsular exopolysaccharide synthesis family protein
MEHIRKALEQAEKDRADVRSRAPASANVADTPVKQISQPAAEVRRERTRVIDVPHEVLLEHRLVSALPDHKLSDSYRMLRTRVLQQMKGHGWNSLAITSPATGCGKSLTAINLAISLAREVNNTVLLVDLDLRSPSIHEYFGYQPQAGIGDYLDGNAEIADILFSPGNERLVILPGRKPIMNSSETLRSPKMVSLVQELTSRYPDRLVIVDLPPMLATDDALTFSPYVDAILMVAEAGETRRDDLETSLQVLKDVPLLGTVLNKAEKTPNQYYGRYGRD